MSNRPIFIDIDGTLTQTPGKQWGVPCYDRINVVKALLDDGVSVVLWSGGGTEYAKAFAARYGLQRAICVGKPEYCVDDNPDIRPKSRMPIHDPQDWFGDNNGYN